MVLMIRCILYPGAKLFVTSGGKEQSAGIIKEKVQEICSLIPAFHREINWERGVTTEGKDYCKYVFKNGSYFDNIAANEKSRGKRRHGFVGEECVGIDGKILSEVLIPITNISRRLANGDTIQEEKLNKSQCMVTTAGYKSTFARLKRFIGELKPREPLTRGVNILNIFANSESSKRITLCQAA